MSESFLYSPWRMKYINSQKSSVCIFCFDSTDDDERLVLYRSQHCFVILNIFPYNNGHIMVVPNAHIASLGDLNPIELQDLFQTVQLSESVIKKVYNPDGINVGINLGKAAGAGVDDHLHVHILPRWFGDTNFMSSVSATRVVPEDFDITAKKMKECFLDGN